MGKIFNVSAGCQPDLHYMVDISERLWQIKAMVSAGQYFTVNRPRQYGKTTTLQALGRYLQGEFSVASLDFQMMGEAKFKSENAFSAAFARLFIKAMEEADFSASQLLLPLKAVLQKNKEELELLELFEYLSELCGKSAKPVVLIIDEIDSAASHQVFLDFLAQLRGYYIKRNRVPTFHSVILSGVYDVKNIKRKLRPEGMHTANSPWNIAADFLVDMSFSAEDIAEMLEEYEEECHTGMNVTEISGLLYDYTSGYPFLVSRLCKLIDERIAGNNGSGRNGAWTRTGFLEAVRMLLSEKNTLFESLAGKLEDYPELKSILYLILFQGQSILYNPDDPSLDMALMFGFVKADSGFVVVANRIFETRLYHMFLALPKIQENHMCRTALQDKSQFIKNGRLDMELILEKFVQHFDDIYGDRGEKFIEEDGRRYFMLYLKPIINGAGNFYIEAQTRNLERTDVIVDYCGEQFIIETKIWHGNSYHTRGEEQLASYLDHYHLKKGYMLSFNFNKNKTIGVKELAIGDKILVEAVV